MARVSIEDCLEHIENRFALVSVASHRARQLMDGDDSLIKSKNREAVTALREIAEGLVLTEGAVDTGRESDEEY
jgi:DNA-directed RNA polymerase subunit omega